MGLGIVADDGFESGRVPCWRGLEQGGELGQRRLGVGVDQLERLVVECQRAGGDKELRAIDQLGQRLGAFLQARQCGRQFVPPGGGEAGREGGSTLRVRQIILDAGEEFGVVCLADVLPVEITELGKVEARRRFTDVGHVEPGNRLFGRKYLVVTMAPAEPRQIVA